MSTASRIGITLLLTNDAATPFDPDSPLRLLFKYLAGLLDRLGGGLSDTSRLLEYTERFVSRW